MSEEKKWTGNATIGPYHTCSPPSSASIPLTLLLHEKRVRQHGGIERAQGIHSHSNSSAGAVAYSQYVRAFVYFACTL